MSELERLEKIKLKRILLDYPFYGYFLIQIKFELDENIPTARTDGKTIWFNPNWTKTLSDRQLITVILHEIKHIVFCHLFRINGRNNSVWNEATDYVINYQLIYEENQQQIDDMFIDSNYADTSAEEVYKILMEGKNERQNEDNNGNDGRSGEPDIKSNGKGTGKSKEEESQNNRGTNRTREEEIGAEAKQTDQGSKEENAKRRIGDFIRPRGDISGEIEKVKEEITKAVRYAEKAGNMPRNMKREIDKILKPKINWENLLANWMFEKAKDDFSWMIRDNRIPDYFFPSLEEETLGKLAIVIDVSGSINRGLYNKFISEVNGLKQKYAFEALVVSFDTKVQNIKRFNKYEPIRFTTNGGGGTAIKPVFDLLKKEVGITGCIIFTDLFIGDIYQIKSPTYDTLWMCYSNAKSVPFGKLINIKGE